MTTIRRTCAGQQVSRPPRQHNRGQAVVSRGNCVDPRRARGAVLAARRGPPRTSSSIHPAAAFLAIGIALRFDVLGLGLGRDAWFTVLAFWFFAAGWAAAKATTLSQRALVTVVLVVGLHGYFDSTLRETLVFTGAAVPVGGGGRCRNRCRGVVVHLPDPLPGVSAVRQPPGLRNDRLDRDRCRDHHGRDPAAQSASRAAGSAGRSRRRLPLRDEPLLDQGRRDQTVVADQARGDDAAATRGRR